MSMKYVMWCVTLIASAGLMGCGESPKKGARSTTAPANQVSDKEHSHGGWWCNEHGVPESVCALCDAKLAADFKAKGDWCQKHDRPESQCFVCHPDKQKEFAALYEAKYGQQPPKPEGAADSHDDHDHAAPGS